MKTIILPNRVLRLDNVFKIASPLSFDPLCIVANRAITFSVKLLVICLLFSTLGACGSGESSATTEENAINAANLKDKSQFKALSEKRGKQPISFNVVENVAYMQGIMDSTIPLLVSNLIKNHPKVNTIVMKKVLGTIDFNATLEAGRLLRKACLTTVVPYMGKIASGGVHFFFAGCNRIIENGGKLGIHTWKHTIVDNSGVETRSWVANEFSTTDPVHDIYLNYQLDMGIPEDFYWTMIDVPFDDMRNLTVDELEIYNISTRKTKSWGAEYHLVVDSETQINWGPARFYVENGIAIMHGKISSRTSLDLNNMLAAHPNVHTLEFGFVTGSISPHTRYALELGYAIRAYCLTTKITHSSYVVAEAVHSYIAGCDREFQEGSRIGVSSWYNRSINETTNETTKAIKNEPLKEDRHANNLQYYIDMGIPQSFYFYQLTFPKSRPNFLNKMELVEFGVLED